MLLMSESTDNKRIQMNVKNTEIVCYLTYHLTEMDATFLKVGPDLSILLLS